MNSFSHQTIERMTSLKISKVEKSPVNSCTHWWRSLFPLPNCCGLPLIDTDAYYFELSLPKMHETLIRLSYCSFIFESSGIHTLIPDLIYHFRPPDIPTLRFRDYQVCLLQTRKEVVSNENPVMISMVHIHEIKRIFQS